MDDYDQFTSIHLLESNIVWDDISLLSSVANAVSVTYV